MAAKQFSDEMCRSYNLAWPCMQLLWHIYQLPQAQADWEEVRDFQISQAGKHLRSLQDKDYLSGPGRHQAVSARPWRLKSNAVDLMQRVKEGLLARSFLSPVRLKVLEAIAGTRTGILIDSITVTVACTSLHRAGYIKIKNPGQATWEMTGAGWQALKEIEENKETDEPIQTE